MTERILRPDGRVVVWLYEEVSIDDGYNGQVVYEFSAIEYWKDDNDTLTFAYKDHVIMYPKHNVRRYVRYNNSEAYVAQELQRRGAPDYKPVRQRQCVECGSFMRPTDHPHVSVFK